MIPISHFLAPDAPPGPQTGRCGVCGTSAAGMYDRRDILDTAGSNITALFPHNTPYMCRHCVALWRLPKRWHRGIFATPEATYFPLIAPGERQSPERPLWRELFHAAPTWQDRPRVCVLTTSPKKRVWPHARVSVGPSLLLYVHDPKRGISSNRLVPLAALQTALTLVEDALALGASHKQVAQTLYTPTLLERHGLARLQALDTALQAMRTTPAFLPALLVAQHQEIPDADSAIPGPSAPPPRPDHQPRARRGRGADRGTGQLDLISS